MGDPEVQATVVLVIGLALGLLVFALMHVLARGRARALRMVEEKTGQLRHQALHDALTGLPNRALIMDRTEQMLAHARAQRHEASAMFIDLDGFKGVNDTFGHPVGDELLRVVAARISNVLRETDTIGRLGGDEFVVLVEGGAEKIAKRIVGDAARAVRPRHRQPDHDHDLDRHRQRRPRGRQGPPARRRHRAVRGQGRRPQPLRRVPPRDAHRRARPARARVRPARRDQAQRAVPRLPAHPRPRDRRDARRRGAAALAAPDPRARSRRPSSSPWPRRAA